MQDQLGRYELTKLIGTGGMAEVFEGYSIGASGFRRRVAIKRLRAAEAGDASMLGMFLDEARICSALHHGNIVSVLDYGVVDGNPFQVMEYVDGVNAADACRRLAAKGAQIPEALALHICRSVARALAHAHEATDDEGPLGIVHRDVKPANILLSWDGEVKLADFGIALGRSRGERTEAGQVKGTPNYMAPEQLTGLGVDARADVFALGCALHALIDGASPIAGLGSSVRLLRGEQPAISPRLAADIVALVKMAIHPDRKARFQSARAMSEALDALVLGRTARDPRAALQELLTTLRPPVQRVGALDQLMSVAFVATATETREYQSVHRTNPMPNDTVVAPPPIFAAEPPTHGTLALASALSPSPATPNVWSPTTQGATAQGPTTQGATAQGATAQGATAQGATAEVSATASAPRVRAVVVVLSLGGLFALGSAALLGRALLERTSSASPPPTASVAVSAPASASADHALAEPPSSASAAPSAIAERTTARATTAPPPPVPRAPPSSRPSSTAGPAEAAAAVTGVGTGFLAFRAREGATRTTIVVDGTPRGFAPRIVELPVGSHNVSYIDASGNPFGSTPVVVRQEFSRQAPRTIDVEAR